jgi:hypothetical protein
VPSGQEEIYKKAMRSVDVGTTTSDDFGYNSVVAPYFDDTKDQSNQTKPVKNTARIFWLRDASDVLLLNYPWIQELYDKLDQKVSAKDMLPMVLSFAKMLEENKYDEVDNILSSIQTQRLHPLFLANLVRTTYPARNRLGMWPEALARVSAELTKRHMDKDKILRGLIS